jgi:hypothetical protein
MITTVENSPFFGAILSSVGDGYRHWIAWIFWTTAPHFCITAEADFRRPTKDEIRQQLSQTIESSWKPKIDELSRLRRLAPEDRKPYVQAILYPARLIFSWDNLAVDSNDRAVEYLREVRPAGLELLPIEKALACRQGDCSADEVFLLNANLNRQFDNTLSYISTR